MLLLLLLRYQDPAAVKQVADLLGVPAHAVETALTSHTLGGGNSRLSCKVRTMGFPPSRLCSVSRP